MDPSLLHSNTTSSNPTDNASMDNLNGDVAAKAEESHDDLFESTHSNGSHPPGEDGSGGQDTSFEGDGDRMSMDKRPRLRLAHACDRCRKRKIRCDTEQPCGPCKATQNECTFNAPPRRIAKPKPPPGLIGPRTGSSSGFKRPHGDEGNGEKTSAQANLEARLAALEAMLGDIPPNVHNMALSTLDARLGGVPLEPVAGQLNGSDMMTQNENWFTGNLAPSTLAGYAASKGKHSGNILQLRPDFRGLRKTNGDVNDVTKRLEGMSFFYEDEIGQAKWQGTTSGFPLLDLLTANTTSDSGSSVEPGQPTLEDEFAFLNPEPSPQETASRSRKSSSPSNSLRQPSPSNRSSSPSTTVKSRFFPDRTPRPHQTLNPEASWKVITGVIPPDLMDTLVRCYLSTSHLLWPFLHVPSFLADYANPQQWGEPGFTCFIVAVCTLSSRHVDDPRVRANPLDPSTAGKSYFQLFTRLRDLPSADRPTLYSIQAAFLAAIYAFGLGNLSKAFALQAESITLCLDGGLHRSVDGYDHFDAIEKETRKRTFWSIYSWDKQSAALFGRPPIINLRVTDTPEPLVVDDENLTATGIKESGKTSNSRMEAFVATIRLHVVLEGILDIGSKASSFPGSPFLSKAAAHLSRRYPQIEDLKDEEELVDEWRAMLPKYWQYDADTTNSRDPIRITQAERLHCLEHLVKMLIYRHQFSGFVNASAGTPEERTRLKELCRKAMQCALTIIADHVHISQRGMMTYYGVHVIHQLAQAGRTLVAVILNCRNVDFRPLIAPSIEGLKSCVGLLRRFSGRYLCGLRSADIIDEFCRICNIPVDSPRVPDGTGRPPPAWLRPVRKRTSPSPVDSTSAPQDSFNNPSNTSNQASLDSRVADLEALFNSNMDDYIDLSALSSPPRPTAAADSNFESFGGTSFGSSFGASNLDNTLQGQWAMSPPTDEAQNPNPWSNGLGNFQNNGNGNTPFDYASLTGMSGMAGVNGNGNGNGVNGIQGFGGELLAGEGMDSVSDGLQSGEGQGLSAATILSLMEEGSFDYSSMFTDQAPRPMAIDETTDETP